MRAGRAAAGLLAVVVAASALAHETWMMPSTFSAKAGAAVRLDVSSGMAFPRLESAIKSQRVARAAYRLAGEEAELTALKTAGTSLVIRGAFPKDGVATVWLDLHPKDIELTDDKVEEYLDEIGADADVRAIWARRKGGAAWKETYTKHAKTFLAVGPATADRSWADGVDQALEIVPKSSPFAVDVGGELTIELRASGKPIAGLPVGLHVEGLKAAIFRTTDAEGRATFKPTKDGRAMLFAVVLRAVDDGQSWNSDFCTLTFSIHKRPD